MFRKKRKFGSLKLKFGRYNFKSLKHHTDVDAFSL